MKEQAKNPSNQFIQKVICATEPTVILSTEDQIADISRFCTHPTEVSIFHADSTFNLVLPLRKCYHFAFSVTTKSTYYFCTEKEKEPSAMTGPLIIHQKKLKSSYKQLSKFLSEKDVQLCCVGTDGEKNFSKSISQVFPSAKHLQYSLHFKNNIKDKLKKH